MMRHIRFALLMTLILALNSASAATAIDFQLLDRSSDANTSPQPGQSLPGCFTNAFNTQGGNLTPTEVLLDISSHALIRGTNCNHQSAFAFVQQSLLVSLIGAPGATTQ